MDDILDVIEGGPKLRRWYGAQQRSAGGASAPQADAAPPAVALPPHAFSVVCCGGARGDATSDALLAALVLADKAPLRCGGRDPAAASRAFGAFVSAVDGPGSLALPGSDALLLNLPGASCLDEAAVLLAAAASAGVGHCVVLCPDACRPAAAPKLCAAAASTPLTVIFSGEVRAAPGAGGAPLQLTACDGGDSGGRQSGALLLLRPVSLEDAAALAVAALDAPPGRGAARLVRAGGAGGGGADEPAKDAWPSFLRALQQSDAVA